MARNPKQDANLKPIRSGDLSKEELKKRQRNGGKKSGEVRRAKRDAKQAIKYLLGLPAQGSLDLNLEQLGFPENERTNMAALQARLFTKAMSGDLDSYTQLMKMGGYEPEENRKERESIEANIRREMEVEAKVKALGGGVENANIAINSSDEEGNNDVVIYLPQLEKEEDCELPPEDEECDSEGYEGVETTE
jgi:hypothetical protein